MSLFRKRPVSGPSEYLWLLFCVSLIKIIYDARISFSYSDILHGRHPDGSVRCKVDSRLSLNGFSSWLL